MLSIAKGYDTGYLTKEVSQGREGYYVAATEVGTEPAGVWYGGGAEVLGLSGEVDAEVLAALYSRLQHPSGDQLPMTRPVYRTAEERYEALLAGEAVPAGPERRDELWAAAQVGARQAVSFFDATFSAPKSVSVVAVAFEQAAVEAERRGDTAAAEAWRAHHRAVEDAVMVGARAVVDYLQEVAGYSRGGSRDAPRWIDAHRFTVAQFLQHDSRERDPQLHVHQAILNAVESADGKWRTLDGAALYLHRGAAGAIGERAMESHLAATLGLRFATRPDGKAREVVGVAADVIAMFSARSRQIGPKLEQLCREWTALYRREPTPLERTRLAQHATLLTRPSKAHDGETVADRLRRWEAQTREQMGAGLRAVADSVLIARQDAGPVEAWDPDDVVARAVDRVARTDSTWTRSDLMRAVSDALPGHLGLHPEQVRPLLEQLTDAAESAAVRVSPAVDLTDRPDEHLLADGGDVFARPGSVKFSAPGQMPAEQVLREAAVERGAMQAPAALAAAIRARYAEQGVVLGDDQAAALTGILTSGARVEVLAAPAGTGKTVVVGAVAEAWARHGRSVVGLAPSQNAADVLSDEGVPAVNIDRWLLQRDHGLSSGDIVVVDEAGMASTQQLGAIEVRCRVAGAKLLLVGDDQQLGAFGPGGALTDLAERAKTYALAEVRRFQSVWERPASLALRDGGAGAVDAYERAGRIRSPGTGEQAERAAVRAWLADTLSGKQSVLLAGSNEAAERMSGAARAELVRLGRVSDDQAITLGRDGNRCAVGDVVQARFNGWQLRTARTPINRATYRVTEVHDDGGLCVVPLLADGPGAPFDLPADYVGRHLSLGYAATVHAAQGRTVDTSHSVISQGWSRALVYVGMTRGRESNTAWCQTVPTGTDSPPGQVQDLHPRTGRAVLAGVLEGDDQRRSAIAERDHLDAEARSECTVVGQLLDGISRATAGQTGALLDRLAAAGAITDQQRVDLAADEAMSAVERLLRAAELGGHDREQVLTEVLEGRSLAGARSPGQVLHHRLHQSLQVDHTIDSFAALVPDGVPERHWPWLERRADDADQRRHELGSGLVADPPAWALDTVGPVPDDSLERVGWETRAGWAAAYREMSGYDSETDPLGPAPPAGLAEKHAVWRTAHQHLGLVDRGPEEGLLSDGALRSRVAAWRHEQQWAPANVHGQLGATAQAADARRVDGMLYAAHGDSTAADVEAEALVLDATARQLDEADRGRQAWFEHTAQTRERAERAAAELRAREVDVDDTSGRVTAQEWLDAHRTEQAAEDQHRAVDVLAEDEPFTEGLQFPAAGPETGVADIRDASERDPSENRDRRDVASMDEARAAVARAQAALAEIRSREALLEDGAEEHYSASTAESEVVGDDSDVDVAHL